VTELAVPLGVGLAVSSGHPLGIALSVVMPALALRAQSRRGSYHAAAVYYAGALWPLIPGANNFFGPEVSLLVAVGFWFLATALLASPWPLVWSVDSRQALWRAPLGLMLAVVPPVGIIGWASPLMAAGFLFPAAGWFGLVGCALLIGALAVWPGKALVTGIAVSLAVNLLHPADPKRPLDWVAVDTHFGAIAHRAPDPLTEFRVAEEIQRQALSTRASVIVFPETVVPYWTASTDDFWSQTLEELKANGQTILVGAKIPTRRGYINTVVLRGSQTAAFQQRIPVPIAMWKPLRRNSASISLDGPGVVSINGRRAAILICYEQLVVWPALTAMVEKPGILIGVANDHWAAGTTIPRFQSSALRSWARLFGIPFLSAVNT
jgi:hypothetical protein